ncbi:MAG: CBS domain-containing protein [Nitrososphaerota archaeon]|nr:CBS domain-containing protein [Nitrososphaerota archaeon]
MPKWECYKCGRVVQSKDPPDECPSCHYSMGIWLRHQEKKVPVVKEFTRRDFLQLEAGETVLTAAEKMRELNLGSTIVMNRGKPVGIVTERDILYKVAAENLVPSTITLRKIMSSPVLTVSSDTPVKDAMKLMGEKGIRRLLVTENGKPLGIISQRAIVGESLLSAKALQELEYPD